MSNIKHSEYCACDGERMCIVYCTCIFCDFCGNDLTLRDETEYLCSCGKKTCSQECHEYISVELIHNKHCETKPCNICKNDILKYGKKGMIVYHHIDGKFEGVAMEDDPDYVKIEILERQIEQLQEKNRDLQTQIDCMPDGKEYLAAKKRFEGQDY